jgi:hypothetical protein
MSKKISSEGWENNHVDLIVSTATILDMHLRPFLALLQRYMYIDEAKFEANYIYLSCSLML